MLRGLCAVVRAQKLKLWLAQAQKSSHAPGCMLRCNVLPGVVSLGRLAACRAKPAKLPVSGGVRPARTRALSDMPIYQHKLVAEQEFASWLGENKKFTAAA